MMIYSTGTKISELRNMIEESISYVISNYICPFARVGGLFCFTRPNSDGSDK
jgi:hypothetical protein